MARKDLYATVSATDKHSDEYCDIRVCNNGFQSSVMTLKTRDQALQLLHELQDFVYGEDVPIDDETVEEPWVEKQIDDAKWYALLNQIREEQGIKHTFWSIGPDGKADELGVGTDFSKVLHHGFCRFVYKDHWGPKPVKTGIMQSPSLAEVWKAFDGLVSICGDLHHSFLEDIERQENDGNVAVFEFHSGS